ncbi:MAG: hypothetical protein ACKO01_14125 [Erythrobacter sp.]
MSLAALTAVLLAAAPVVQAPAAVAPAMMGEAPELAADILVGGRHAEAITRLERERAVAPWSAPVLINLGVAYAERGDTIRAREAFRDAAGASETVKVVTADGTQTDTRTLARRGLRILERGALAMDARARSQLTLRD